MIHAAITIDTEFPTSWDDPVAEHNCARLAALSAKLGIPFTWMIKFSAQDTQRVAAHFFRKVRPSLPPDHEVGLHVHFDDEQRQNYLTDPAPRQRLMRTGWEVLRQAGVSPRCFRAGCFRLAASDLAMLVALGITVDSSVAPGAIGTKDMADWHAAATTTPYHPDPQDPGRPGHCPITEVPVLTDGREPLFLDRWQETSRALAVLDIALARGDQFLCLLGHDGSSQLDSVRQCCAKLVAVGARFVTLSSLANQWRRSS